MTLSVESKSSQLFDRLPRRAQSVALILLVGVILFLAVALGSGGETPFLYATF
jgi:hypothetical protein